MPLIKGGKTVEDSWVYLNDDAPLPDSGDIIVTYERFKDKENFANFSGRIGVELPNNLDAINLKDELEGVELIVLRFPAFADGRAFSQAWQIRHKLRYTGELRAAGEVFADQAAFMMRTGFNSFEVDGNQPIEIWHKALESMTHAYQPGYGEKAKSIRRAVIVSE